MRSLSTRRSGSAPQHGRLAPRLPARRWSPPPPPRSRAARPPRRLRAARRRPRAVNPYPVKLLAFVAAGILAAGGGIVYLLLLGGATPTVSGSDFTSACS